MIYENSPLPFYPGVIPLPVIGIQNDLKSIYGDMPESLFRQIIGEGFWLSHLKQIFAHLMTKAKELKQKENLSKVNLRYLAHKELPDIFIHPKDDYIASILINA